VPNLAVILVKNIIMEAIRRLWAPTTHHHGENTSNTDKAEPRTEQIDHEMQIKTDGCNTLTNKCLAVTNNSSHLNINNENIKRMQ
jgi:hypothetical protein